MVQKVSRGPYEVKREGRVVVLRRQVIEETELDTETLDLHILNLQRQRRQLMESIAEIDEQLQQLQALRERDGA